MRKAFLALLLAASVTPALAQEKTFELKIVALGAGLASAAEGAGGLGRRGREGIRRHHQVQGVPGAAARQGVRPLRHGARRHRRRHLRQSGLSARPLPDHRRRRTAVPDVGCQGRLDGARRLVPQICREGDEGRQVLPRLHPFAVVVPFAHQEDRGARRRQGHEDPSRPTPPWRISSPSSAAPTCSPRRRRSATSSSAASPTPSPSRGDRWCCSASTR